MFICIIYTIYFIYYICIYIDNDYRADIRVGITNPLTITFLWLIDNTPIRYAMQYIVSY